MVRRDREVYKMWADWHQMKVSVLQTQDSKSPLFSRFLSSKHSPQVSSWFHTSSRASCTSRLCLSSHPLCWVLRCPRQMLLQCQYLSQQDFQLPFQRSKLSCLKDRSPPMVASKFTLISNTKHLETEVSYIYQCLCRSWTRFRWLHRPGRRLC